MNDILLGVWKPECELGNRRIIAGTAMVYCRFVDGEPKKQNGYVEVTELNPKDIYK